MQAKGARASLDYGGEYILHRRRTSAAASLVSPMPCYCELEHSGADVALSQEEIVRACVPVWSTKDAIIYHV